MNTLKVSSKPFLRAPPSSLIFMGADVRVVLLCNSLSLIGKKEKKRKKSQVNPRSLYESLQAAAVKQTRSPSSDGSHGLGWLIGHVVTFWPCGQTGITTDQRLRLGRAKAFAGRLLV